MQKQYWSLHILLLISFYSYSHDNGPTDPNLTFHAFDNQECPSLVLYAHSFKGSYRQAIRLFAHVTGKNEHDQMVYNPHWLFDGPLALFNFPDAKNDITNTYHRNFVNLGQHIDIERLGYAHHMVKSQVPSCNNIIGCGVSRGGATWIMYMSLYKPTDVHALIIEAPFDHLDSVLENILKKYGIAWLPGVSRIAKYLVQLYFPALDLQAKAPIDVVDQLPLDLPILLIHGKTDAVVPINCSRTLYLKLRASGHQNVYLLELEQGIHGKLIKGLEAERYQHITHAFLHKYNFSCCQLFAQQGAELLAKCQPTQEEVLHAIKTEPGFSYSLPMWIKNIVKNILSIAIKR